MRAISATLGCVGVLLAAGCVERQLVIQSEPSDALVLVDGHEAGRSPAVVKFTFYGTRRIVLKKEGYETTTAFAEVRPPWYQFFPIDFVSEILVPTRIVDRHEFTYTLKEATPAKEEALLDRAEALRTEVRQP